MREKLTFSEKIRKRYHEIAMREDEAMAARGRAYSEYFENWLEYEVTNPSGKKRVVRVYDGAWYSHKLSRGKRIGLLALYTFMILASAALFCIAAIQTISANNSKIILFTEALVLIGIVLSVYNLFSYVLAPVKMTVGQFKGASLALIKTLKYSCFVMAVNTAAMFIHAIVNAFGGGAKVLTEFVCVLAFALGGILSYGVLFIEKNKVKYDITPSKPKAPKDGEKIRDRDLVL